MQTIFKDAINVYAWTPWIREQKYSAGLYERKPVSVKKAPFFPTNDIESFPRSVFFMEKKCSEYNVVL